VTVAVRIVLAFVLASTAAACAAPTPSALSSAIATELATRPTTVDLASLPPSGWDRIAIFGPYTTPEQVDSVLGFRFNDENLTQSISKQDGDNLFILVSGQSVVHAELVLRNVVDFGDKLPLDLGRSDARFRVTWTDRPILTRSD